MIPWIYNKFIKSTKRTRDSLTISFTILVGLSSILAIAGVSLEKLTSFCVWQNLLILLSIYIISCVIVYTSIGWIFKKSIQLSIRKMTITIKTGNIFKEPGLRVIGCDRNFTTIVDDVVISKSSLHGQLVENHGSADDINAAVAKAAQELNLKQNTEKKYKFPLGSIVRYHSNQDNHDYLLLAMMELNKKYEAHTTTREFEQTLTQMWKEIDRVYARKEIVLPLLGSGISRFDDGVKDDFELLRSMLYTLSSSGVNLKSPNISIVIYKDIEHMPLYELKDIFHTM